MCLNENNKRKDKISHLFQFVVVFATGCVVQAPQLAASDIELAQLMDQYSGVTINVSREEFFKNDTLDVDSLASQLDSICQKRKISRAAVLSSVRLELFFNGKDCIAFALKKCGFYVDGILFHFDGKEYVQRVRTFSAVL